MRTGSETRRWREKLARLEFLRGGRFLAAISVLSLLAAGVAFGAYLRVRHYRQILAASIAAQVPVSPGPPLPPGIVFHHSYTKGTIHGKLVDLAKLAEMHTETHPEWSATYEGKTYHIGYHYVIMTDGTVQKGRPDLCPGAHARLFNNWIGICLVGTFATHTRYHWKPDHPTPEQLASLISLCEKLMADYHIPPQMIKRHRDVNMTYCPGDNFPYDSIIRQLTEFADAHPEIYPTPPIIPKIVRAGPPPHKH